MGTFEVEHKRYRDERIKVYAVDYGVSGELLFLTYREEWTWVTADNYIPYVDRM